MKEGSVLITGGAGFVGTSLAIGLNARCPALDVICLDNLSRRGSEHNISRLEDEGIEFVHGDIRNREDLQFRDANFFLILDCSAEPSVLSGFNSPDHMTRTNLVGSLNCFELARHHSSDLIFLSTSRVYPIGPLRELNIREEETRFELGTQEIEGASEKGVSEKFPIRGGRSLYGATKYSSELVLQEYASSFGFNAIINRCGVIAGPWQMGKVDQGVFTFWLLSHYFEDSLQYIGFGGTGKQVRDVIHVDDLIDLIEVQIEDMDTLSGEVFNVGGGREYSLSLLEATEMCREITGNKVPIEPVDEERPGDIPLYISDNSKVEKKTGWSPSKSPKEVLSDTHAWIESNESIFE
jgi:CDP-paratose 2-epimerase